MTTEKQIVIDKIILACNGCMSERVIHFDVPLRGAQELIDFMNTKVIRWCDCGAKTCDVKAHLQEES